MTKIEWRKHDKSLYLPTKKPVTIEVPEMNYLTIRGSGNPNGEAFQKNVEALYSLSYGIKMLPKKGVIPEGYYDYTVYPLEGHWDLDEEGRKLDYLDKNHFVYQLMIRQPDFVTEALFQEVAIKVKQKKSNIPIEAVKFESINEGLCVQAMHLGSYETEPETFAVMEKYCEEQKLTRLSKTHKEIYISDPRKSAPDKMKTVLRIQVSNN